MIERTTATVPRDDQVMKHACQLRRFVKEDAGTVGCSELEILGWLSQAALQGRWHFREKQAATAWSGLGDLVAVEIEHRHSAR